MGTRNLTIVINDNRPIIAQYGQWDGNPGVQGMNILKLLKSNDFDVYKLKDKLKQCRFINDSVIYKKAHENFSKSIGIVNDMMNREQSKLYFKKYPFLSRDHGGEILRMIYEYDKNDLIMLNNSYNFAGDSLFCEWAYVIDLDLMTFEVYRGLNHEPLTPNERFYPLQNGLVDDPEYYPVKHLATYQLSNIRNLSTFQHPKP